MRRWWAIAAVAVAAIVVGLVVYVVHERQQRHEALAGPPLCHAHAAGSTVVLGTHQARNAALIAAVAARRGLPPRAVSITLTAALQESKLINLLYGDSDSLGLFQQRPSQGWGSPEQLLNRTYATNAFFDELQRVPGYESMEISAAAQAVQRSAYPSLYLLHEREGRVLASALTGYSPAGFWCTSSHVHRSGRSATPVELASRLATVRSAVSRQYGEQFAAVSQICPRACRRSGVLVVRPVGTSAETRPRAWSVASYLVANAARLHIADIRLDGRRWTAGAGSDRGWRSEHRARAAAQEAAARTTRAHHRLSVRVR